MNVHQNGTPCNGHPAQPPWDFTLLEAHLIVENLYSPESVDRLKCRVWCHGTLEGAAAQDLDDADREMADWALETGQAAIPWDDARWSDPAVYLDAETIFERSDRRVPISAAIMPPELEDFELFEPSATDWADYGRIMDAMDDAMDFPRTTNDDDRRQFQRDVIDFYHQNPEA